MCVDTLFKFSRISAFQKCWKENKCQEPAQCLFGCFPALWFASRIFSVECMGQLLTLHFWCLNLSHGLFKDHPSEASGLFPIDPQVYHDYFVHIFGLQYELLFFCFSILIFLFHFSLPFASHSMTFSGTLSFNLIYFFYSLYQTYWKLP